MTLPLELRARVANGDQSPADADILWYHAGFCQFALPAEPGGTAPWQRVADGTSVSIEPGTERDRVPGGPWLRRLLMFLCDSAQRSGQAQVVLGDDAAALAGAIDPALAGADIAGLEAQVASLLGCRILVALDGGPGLSVLDARGRPRAVAAEWRGAVRLNARFLETLAREKVALDRAAVSALHGDALALDLYAWLCLALPGQEGQVLAESWPDLQTHFGTAGQDGDAFQAQCSAALARLRAACPALEVEEDAIGVGFSARAPQDVAPAPEPTPVPPPAAPRAEPPPPPPPPAPEIAAPAAEAPAPMPREPEPRGRAPRPDVVRPDVVRPDVVSRDIAPAESVRAETARAEPTLAEPTRAEAPRDVPPAMPQFNGAQPMRQTISIRSHLTGLQQVVWLQRANGRDNVVIEVTPGSRYDPALVTVLALEPIVLQVAGGLHARDFERVSSWATANRDLIDAFWDGQIDGFDEIMQRVRKVPAPGWR